jgi:hypothetical protein
VRPSCTLALVRVEEKKRGDGARHAANLHSRGTLTRRIRTWNRGCATSGNQVLPSPRRHYFVAAAQSPMRLPVNVMFIVSFVCFIVMRIWPS